MEWHNYLPKEKKEQIIAQIPRINDERFRLAVDIDISLTITDHMNKMNLKGAIGCLDDARKRYSLIQYSLYEALTCVTWHREFARQPSEENAIFTGEYYLSYAALLAYAIAEDISSFIIHFMNIQTDFQAFLKSEKGIRKLEKRNITSNAAKVGIYLLEKHKTHPITGIVSNLNNYIDWQKVMEYRNSWVHEKPPSIKGSGADFTREKNVIEDANGREVTILNVAFQKYSLDEFCKIVLNATDALATVLMQLGEIIISKKQELSLTFIQPGKDQL